MCKMMEDMRNETVYEAKREQAIQNALEMLKDNVPVEKVAQYSGLSLDDIATIKQENDL